MSNSAWDFCRIVFRVGNDFDYSSWLQTPPEPFPQGWFLQDVYPLEYGRALCFDVDNAMPTQEDGLKVREIIDRHSS